MVGDGKSSLIDHQNRPASSLQRLAMSFSGTVFFATPGRPTSVKYRDLVSLPAGHIRKKRICGMKFQPIYGNTGQFKERYHYGLRLLYLGAAGIETQQRKPIRLGFRMTPPPIGSNLRYRWDMTPVATLVSYLDNFDNNDDRYIDLSDVLLQDIDIFVFSATISIQIFGLT